MTRVLFVLCLINKLVMHASLFCFYCSVSDPRSVCLAHDCYVSDPCSLCFVFPCYVNKASSVFCV